MAFYLQRPRLKNVRIEKRSNIIHVCINVYSVMFCDDSLASRLKSQTYTPKAVGLFGG